MMLARARLAPERLLVTSCPRTKQTNPMTKGMNMEKKFYVYVHRRASDGRVFYVGKGSKKRLTETYGRSEYWRRVSEKHGWSAHIVARFSQEQCALSFEVALIKLIGRESLTNATMGGEGVCKPSEYVRQKMRAAKIGKPPAYLSDENKAKSAREKQAASARIKIVSSLGEVFESGRHAVAFLRKNGFPSASPGNIASCVNGKMPSAYQRTWAKLGCVPPSYDGFLRKKKNAKSKEVLRSDGFEFSSASEAARVVGGSQGNISMVCRGERKEAYGYGWSYKCN